MPQPKEIVEAALKRAPEQREAIINDLWARLDGSLGNEWEDEIRGRVQDVDVGRGTTIPVEEVLSRLEQRATLPCPVGDCASIRRPTRRPSRPARWYDDRSPGLGGAFVDALAETTMLVLEAPKRRRRVRGARRYLMSPDVTGLESALASPRS